MSNQITQPLVSSTCYDHVFGEWRQAKALLFHDSGNPGDKLIRLGERRLFGDYQIECWPVEELLPGQDFIPDVVFFGGGGNMSYAYDYPTAQRRAAIRYAKARHLPIVVLPQSWECSVPEFHDCYRLFAREAYSMRHENRARLAPDCALAYVPSRDYGVPAPVVGELFRRDREGMVAYPKDSQDPSDTSLTAESYLALIAAYQEIHTDRLHCAIGAMMLGRDVTLYPNNYHKNKGVFEMWLQSRGCKFAEF